MIKSNNTILNNLIEHHDSEMKKYWNLSAGAETKEETLKLNAISNDHLEYWRLLIRLQDQIK